MWEWSKSRKKNIPERSLKNRFGDLLSPPPTAAGSDLEIPSPERMKEIILAEIRRENLLNIELKKCTYHPQTWNEMTKSSTQYLRMRKTFLKLIGYSAQEDCRKIGFDEEDIELLKEKISPENYNTHIKIPLEFGGKLDMNNLCLIKTHPLHDQIHHLIDIQISCGFLQKYKFIYIPWFEGKIYHD